MSRADQVVETLYEAVRLLDDAAGQLVGLPEQDVVENAASLVSTVARQIAAKHRLVSEGSDAENDGS